MIQASPAPPALPELPDSLFATAMNAVDACVAIIQGPELRYTFVNPAYQAILPGVDMLGRRLGEVFAQAAQAGTEDALRRVLESGRPWRIERFHAPVPGDAGALWEGEAVRLDDPARANGEPASILIFMRNVSAAVSAERALRENSALLRAISDTSADVIFAKDRAGRFQFANPATLALIGKPLDQVAGRTDLDVLSDPAAAADVMRNDRLVMDSGKPIEFEETVPSPGGENRTWLSRKIPYVDAAGAVIGVLGISRDITRRKRAEQDLRESNSRKDEFLAMLAHELRNPLAPIATGAQLLEQCAWDEKRVRLTSRVIARQALHMASLLDDLLDVSRVTRGHILLKKEALDMGAVLADAVEQASPLMQERGHQFHGPAGAPAMPVYGDRTRLVQAVSNLLNNAAKYTAPGGTIILAASADERQVTVVVSDNGVGIDAELLPSVFGLFTQGERTPDRTQGGLGLGLALVKSIVTMHDGEVGATSAGAGQGSSFVISLPRLRDTS